MKPFNNPFATVAIVLISVLNRDRLVVGLPSSKLGSSPGSSSSSGSSVDGSKDLKTDGSSFWSPQPEYYHERDRYGSSRPGSSDFVTSYGSGGSYENKYGGGSSLSSSSSFFGSKDRYSEGFLPF